MAWYKNIGYGYGFCLWKRGVFALFNGRYYSLQWPGGRLAFYRWNNYWRKTKTRIPS